MQPISVTAPPKLAAFTMPYSTSNDRKKRRRPFTKSAADMSSNATEASHPDAMPLRGLNVEDSGASISRVS